MFLMIFHKNNVDSSEIGFHRCNFLVNSSQKHQNRRKFPENSCIEHEFVPTEATTMRNEASNLLELS